MINKICKQCGKEFEDNNKRILYNYKYSENGKIIINFNYKEV